MDSTQQPGDSIPVVQEQLRIDNRRVPTAKVRVHTTVQTREETIDEPVIEERVEVERVPIGRIVETAPPVRQEGDATIVPVVEEVLVVEKRLMLREEVRLTKRRVERRSPQRVLLRREEVHIDREDIPPHP